MATASPLPQADVDEILARALIPPATPADLQARVTAAIAQADARDIAPSRLQQHKDHTDSVYNLRRQLFRRCVETVVLAACMVLPVRLAIHALSLRLGGLLASPSPVLAGLLSLALAVLAAILILVLLAGTMQPTHSAQDRASRR